MMCNKKNIQVIPLWFCISPSIDFMLCRKLFAWCHRPTSICNTGITCYLGNIRRDIYEQHFYVIIAKVIYLMNIITSYQLTLACSIQYVLNSRSPSGHS